jgi:hypothetical protein
MYGRTDGNFSGSMELGGHGTYLTGAVHGTQVDIVRSCVICHTTMSTSSSNRFEFSLHTTGVTDWDGNGTAQDELFEIEGMKRTLLRYFGDGANRWGGAGKGPIGVGKVAPLADFTPAALPGGTITTSTVLGSAEWHKDFELNQANLSLSWAEAKALWNLELFLEDKSAGIHNPRFAAQIFYDAITNLNVNGATPALPIGGTRPASY